MRQFIKLSLTYLFFLIILTIASTESFEYLVKRKAIFKLNTKSKYLVLGHSHPQCAFNDSLIENLKNLSESAESYYYTYFKAKQIIKFNPSIEIVFLEYTNNQIKETMNDWIWDEKHMNLNYPRYAPFMSIYDKMILAKNNSLLYPNAIIQSLKNNYNRIITQDYSFTKDIGGFYPIKESHTDSMIEIINKDPSLINLKKGGGTSEYNLKFLSKTIDFCEENGIKVILVRSPQHKIYNDYCDESTYQQIKSDHYSSVEYLDFSKFPLSNDEFADPEHLNSKGAAVFSQWFNQLLIKGFLEKSNKQAIIDKEIKARIPKNI